MTTKPPTPVYFLIVDDLEDNLVALEALLRRKGLVVLKANSGVNALELLLKYDVALALIDVQMPGMDGFELAELMRGTDRTRRVPIIFLTAGSADWQRRFRGYEAGAVDFLQKPIEADILRSKADVFYQLYCQRQEVAQQRDELREATEANAKLLEESRSQALALQEADRRKDEFLAVLAHELRNPLAPIKNAAEILHLVAPENPELTAAREVIDRQVSHMSRLIDDLLDVARIARGKITLRNEHCDLATITRETADDYRLPLKSAGIELNLHLPPEPVTVFGDRTRLAQVLGNLLHNARKFTPAGGSVTIELDRSSDVKWTTLTVSDTGIGIEPNVLARMFEPFSQADQPLARVAGGLGLGLALAKGLIELHGGTITGKSDGANQGSLFTIRLPVSVPATSRSTSSDDLMDETNRSRLRILIVEDNQDSAVTIQRLLTLLGHEAAVVFDGNSALDAILSQSFDVVISDLGLPGALDGYHLAQQIRGNHSASQNLFLIALSGYGQDEDRERSRAAGFDKHLVKPVDISQLQQILLTDRESRI